LKSSEADTDRDEAAFAAGQGHSGLSFERLEAAGREN
jgi:hypothetical protein